MRTVAHTRFGRPLSADDIPDLLCGILFSDLLMNIIEKTSATLQEAEESYRIFYKLVEDILSVKEDEERARQRGERII